MLREELFYLILLAFWNDEFEYIQRRPGVVPVEFFSERINPLLVHKKRATLRKTQGGFFVENYLIKFVSLVFNFCVVFDGFSNVGTASVECVLFDCKLV
jgi:hypothetical protein